MKYIVILLFAFIFNENLQAHPLHVTVTNVEFNKEKQKLDVSIKIFQDDFQGIIYHLFGVDLKLGATDELPDASKYIDLYIAKHLKIIINKKKNTTLRLIDYKKIDLAIYLNYEIDLPSKKISKITIENTLMTDMFLDQSNLLILTFLDLQLAEKFSNQLLKQEFDINSKSKLQ